MPDTDNIVQLSKLFDVSTDYLLKDGVENLTEVMLDVTVAENFNDKWAIISLGLIFAGLATALIGWRTWQTLVPVEVGFLIQLTGCICFTTYYSSRVDKRQAANKQKRFQAIGAWLLFPVPVCVIVFGAFNFYPRPYNNFAPYILSFALYAALAISATIPLQKNNTN